MTSQSDSASCSVQESRVGEINVVGVAGTVDMLTTSQLEEAIDAAAKDSPTAVIVDLTAVDFLASAGMGVLVATKEALGDAVRFAVVADGPATSRPLELVGITDVVDVFKTLDEAVTALQA